MTLSITVSSVMMLSVAFFIGVLSVIMLSVVMLNVVMLRVVAPFAMIFNSLFTAFSKHCMPIVWDIFIEPIFEWFEIILMNLFANFPQFLTICLNCLKLFLEI
jgi:hypothetical protein